MLQPINQLSGRDQAALRSAIRAFKYERSDDGILVPSLGLRIGGYFTVNLNGGPDEPDKNRVVNQGLNDLLDVYLRNQSQTAAWYVALFSGNVTPQATWTAANFASNATEFTNYTESTRVAYTPAAAASQSIDNTANRAVFTADTGGGTVYGAALLSASGKSATTGKLFSSARFATPKVLDEADVLNVAYTVGAGSS